LRSIPYFLRALFCAILVTPCPPTTLAASTQIQNDFLTAD
jgi:hypothetical protein